MIGSMVGIEPLASPCWVLILVNIPRGRRAYDLRANDHATLEDHFSLRTEPGRVPDDEVGQLADFDASDKMGHALRDGRVDRVFADVSLHAEIVGARALVLWQWTTLLLVLVGCVPGP